VRKMVELHSGSISVESEEGAGSTFTVRVPVGVLPGET
jgi:signal transduction histidine kinase